MDVKSADKKPEKYVGADGKPRVRMVPVDKQVIKKESVVDEVSLSAIKKAVQGSGLSNVKRAMPTDKLKKDLAKMKLKLATEGTLFEATDMNKLKQLATAGLVKKGDVQKLLRVFGKMESGKTVTPAEREMLLGVLSDMTALITGDMSMLQKAKKAVKEETVEETVEEKYRPATQAEIDADKKKDRMAQRAAGKQRPSVSLKSIRQKQYGKMMGGLKKESVELEEKAPKMQGDFLKKERERNRAHDAAMGRTPTGRKKPVRQMTSTQKSLAKLRGEDYKSEYQHHVQGKKDAEADMKSAKNNADMVKAMNKKQHHAKALSKMNRMESTKLDELSPRTKASYLKKASSQNKKVQKAYDKSVKSSPDAFFGDDSPKDKERMKTMTKRQKGMAMAKGRKYGQKYESVDEVLDTPKAMYSYKNKAKYSRDRAANSAAAKMLRNPKGFHSTDTSDELKTMDKRTKGLKMADKAAARKTFKALRKGK